LRPGLRTDPAGGAFGKGRGMKGKGRGREGEREGKRKGEGEGRGKGGEGVRVAPPQTAGLDPPMGGCCYKTISNT